MICPKLKQIECEKKSRNLKKREEHTSTCLEEKNHQQLGIIYSLKE